MWEHIFLSLNECLFHSNRHVHYCMTVLMDSCDKTIFRISQQPKINLGDFAQAKLSCGSIVLELCASNILEGAGVKGVMQLVSKTAKQCGKSRAQFSTSFLAFFHLDSNTTIYILFYEMPRLRNSSFVFRHYWSLRKISSVALYIFLE